MDSALELKLQKQAIKIYKETALTPEKLLGMYQVSVSALEKITPLIKVMLDQEKHLEKILLEQTEEIKTLKNTQKATPEKSISEIYEVTSMKILQNDIKRALPKMSDANVRGSYESLYDAINKVFLKMERTIMIKHSFNFYADLSRQMGVPENLISENLTHAEIYFDKFYQQMQKENV